MQEIKRLIQIIQRLSGKNSLQVLDFITVSESSPVIYQKLLAMIQQGKVKDDNDAAAAMYEGANSEDQRYRMLKSRSLAKLNALLLFWTFERAGADPEIECLACISKAKIFRNEHEYDLAEKQLKKAMEIATQGELTELRLMALRMMLPIQSTLHRPNRLRDVISKINECEALFKAEDEATQIYQVQSYRINKSANSRAVHLHETPEQLQKLQRLWQQTNSSNIFLQEFDLRVSYYIHSRQYKESLDYCQKTESLLEKGKINTLRFNFAHLYHALTLSFLKARTYEAALNYSKTGFKHISVSARESLDFHEIYFVCALRVKKFETAEKLYKKVLKKLTGTWRKQDLLTWKVLYGYLHLYTGQTEGEASGDFENLFQAAELSSDNALLIRLNVLKIIFLLKGDRINEFLDLYPQIDDLLKNYRTDDTIEADRLMRFGKFLYQLVALNFEPVAVKKRTSNILRKLEIAYDPYSPTEVVPFDEVAHFIMSHLKVTHEEIRFGKQ